MKVLTLQWASASNSKENAGCINPNLLLQCTYWKHCQLWYNAPFTRCQSCAFFPTVPVVPSVPHKSVRQCSLRFTLPVAAEHVSLHSFQQFDILFLYSYMQIRNIMKSVVFSIRVAPCATLVTSEMTTGIVVSEVTINAAGMHHTWHSFSLTETKKRRGHSWHLIKEARHSKSTCSNLFLTADMVTWEKMPAGPTEHSLRTQDNLCRLEIQKCSTWYPRVPECGAAKPQYNKLGYNKLSVITN